jgi:hypothetical protein
MYISLLVHYIEQSTFCLLHVLCGLPHPTKNTGGAEWWSPRSFKRAGERQVQREQAEEEKKLRKSNMKELKASNALFNKKLQEQRRVERERE